MKRLKNLRVKATNLGEPEQILTVCHVPEGGLGSLCQSPSPGRGVTDPALSQLRLSLLRVSDSPLGIKKSNAPASIAGLPCGQNHPEPTWNWCQAPISPGLRPEAMMHGVHAAGSQGRGRDTLKERTGWSLFSINTSPVCQCFPYFT